MHNLDEKSSHNNSFINSLPVNNKTKKSAMNNVLLTQ
jgi:hypothetical protein